MNYKKDFEALLTYLNFNNITTLKQLSSDEILYTNYWVCAKNFVEFYALKAKTSQNKDYGNYQKTRELIKNGVCTKDELVMDCTMKLVTKFDNIVKASLEYQVFYCFRIVNNVVNDCFKNTTSKEIKFVSLQDSFDTKDDSITYEEVIGTDVTPETVFFEKEEIQSKLIQLKKDCLKLASRRDELLVYLYCSVFNGKPRHLTKELMTKGELNILDETIKNIQERYSIDVYDIIKDTKVKSSSLSSLQDEKRIADQISKLSYRAKNRIK